MLKEPSVDLNVNEYWALVKNGAQHINNVSSLQLENHMYVKLLMVCFGAVFAWYYVLYVIFGINSRQSVTLAPFLEISF